MTREYTCLCGCVARCCDDLDVSLRLIPNDIQIRTARGEFQMIDSNICHCRE